jgi:hypothetical protein
MDIYNNINQTEQNVYDTYNNFVFSSDTRVFNKMIKKTELYLLVKDLLGDIVEFGVFKGSGMALYLKLKDMYEPNGLTKIIGFDYFEPTLLLDSLTGTNKEMMQNVLSRVDQRELSIDSVKSRLSVFSNSNYMLIKGDAVIESEKYYNAHKGARIKMLYMDLDLGKPTYTILKQLWSKVIENGIVILDEYAYHSWDESDGVDMFLREIKGQYTLVNTHIFSPTLYIKKILI